MIELPDMRLTADVELDIGDDTSKHVQRQAIIDRYAPRYTKYPVGLNVLGNAASSQFVTDEPTTGRRLELLRFHLDIATPIVGGQSVTEPTTIIVYLVAASDLTNLNNLSSANVLKRYATLPIDDNYPHRSIITEPVESIYIVATNSGATPVSLAGNLQTVNRPSDAYHDPKDIRDLLDSWNL